MKDFFFFPSPQPNSSDVIKNPRVNPRNRCAHSGEVWAGGFKHCQVENVCFTARVRRAERRRVEAGGLPSARPGRGLQSVKRRCKKGSFAILAPFWCSVQTTHLNESFRFNHQLNPETLSLPGRTANSFTLKVPEKILKRGNPAARTAFTSRARQKQRYGLRGR